MGSTSGEVITIDSDSEDYNNYTTPVDNVGGCYIKFRLDDSGQLHSDNNVKDNNTSLVNNKSVKNLTKIINENDLDGKEGLIMEENFYYNDNENDDEGNNGISEESNQSKEAIESEDNKYKCDECSKSYKNRISLQKHEKIHGITTYQCDRCNKCFSQSASLKNHRQTHPPLECSQCFSIFSSQTEFDEHVETHAPPALKKRKKKADKALDKPKVNQFVCHVCKWDSKNFNKLRAHCVKSHKVVLFQCNYCYEIMKSKEEKEKHKDYDCPKNEFKCRSCLKRFPYDSTLKRHKTICESRKSTETQTENGKENENDGDEIVTLSD